MECEVFSFQPLDFPQIHKMAKKTFSPFASMDMILNRRALVTWKLIDKLYQFL